MTRAHDHATASLIESYADAAPEGAASSRLNEREVYDLLAAAGFAVPDSAVMPVDADQAARAEWCLSVRELAADRGRVVLKALGRNLLHKSDVGGVRVLDADGETPDAALLEAADAMAEAVAVAAGAEELEGLLAVAFTPHPAEKPGGELLISLRQDPAFGPVVVLGVGGVLTEWYGRGTAGRSRVILPARGLDADVVRSVLEGHPVLGIAHEPSRLHAEPPVRTENLVAAVLAVAGLAERHAADRPGATLEEIEINPAVPVDGGLVALDGVGLVSRRVEDAAARPLRRIGNLLHPRSAVVLGVSAKGANPGRIILSNLLRSPGVDAERLHVVHRSEAEIDGVPCVPTLSDLPAKVDLAVVCIPAEGARDAIAELVSGDLAESIILIPGGFAEAGHTELALEIETTLRDGHARPEQGPVMVGGNCLGIVSRDEYNTFFLPDYKLPFRDAECGSNLALVSQSGAYLVTFASNYDGRINPRASISFGNQMDLTASDFLRHFLDVEEVDVIACYVEGFRPGDGRRFLDGVREARRRGKRVVVFKAGKTPQGAKAAASHTASLAGDYDVAKSCLELAGAVVSATLDEFEDMIKTFALLGRRAPAGTRVGIMSNAGFECSTVMDALDGLELAAFAPETRAALDEALPAFAHRDNPIDATPMAGTEAYAASVAAVMADPGVDVGILSSVPVTQALDNLPADPERHREDLAGERSQAATFLEILRGSAKPAVVVIDSGELYDPLVEAIESRGVPVFRKIDRAARALARFVATASA